MSELTKGFGVYSLPIRVVRYAQRNGKTILTLYMGEKINNYLLSTNRSHVFPVLEFMAKGANLMPEAVEVLNEADDHMGALLAAVCDDCPKLGTEDCEECPPYKTLRKIGVLLAKLEGGAEDERD